MDLWPQASRSASDLRSRASMAWRQAAAQEPSPTTRGRRQQRTARHEAGSLRRHTEWECSSCWKTNWMALSNCRGCERPRDYAALDRVILGRDATELDQADAQAYERTRPRAPTARPPSQPPAGQRGQAERPGGAQQRQPGAQRQPGPPGISPAAGITRPQTALQQARAQATAAAKAGFPRATVTAMLAHVETLERQQREARPIGAQLDSARAAVRRTKQAYEKAKEASQAATVREQEAEAELQRATDELAELTAMAAGTGHEDTEEQLAQVLAQVCDAAESTWLPTGHGAEALFAVLHTARETLSRSRSPAPTKLELEYPGGLDEDGYGIDEESDGEQGVREVALPQPSGTAGRRRSGTPRPRETASRLSAGLPAAASQPTAAGGGMQQDAVLEPGAAEPDATLQHSLDPCFHEYPEATDQQLGGMVRAARLKRAMPY